MYADFFFFKSPDNAYLSLGSIAKVANFSLHFFPSALTLNKFLEQQVLGKKFFIFFIAVAGFDLTTSQS